MAKFIKLTIAPEMSATENEPIWLNVEQIIAVRDNRRETGEPIHCPWGAYSSVYTSRDNAFLVTETAEEIIRLINEQ